MNYSELTINQKINIKSKVGVYFGKPLIARVSVRDPWRFGSPNMPWYPARENSNNDLGWNQSFS